MLLLHTQMIQTDLNCETLFGLSLVLSCNAWSFPVAVQHLSGLFCSVVAFFLCNNLSYVGLALMMFFCICDETCMGVKY